MGVGLGVTLIAATVAVIVGYSFFAGLAVEKAEKAMARRTADKD